MSKSWAEKRKRYTEMIGMYTRRRQELRKKYGVTTVHRHLPAAYRRTARIYMIKMMTWKTAIRKIDKTVFKISNLERAVFEFTDVRIAEHKGMKVKGDVWIAKALYYKFGIESGITGVNLRSYIGLGILEVKREPGLFRSRFTRSFSTNPENKELWIRFKVFYENQYLTSKSAGKRAYSTRVTKNKTKLAA
jgi:hypothetical protein